MGKQVKKPAKQTTRAQQCKTLSKQRASRQRREQWRRRYLAAGSLAGGVALVALGLWGWQSDALGRLQDRQADAFWQATAGWGFELRDIYLSGHNKVAREEILAALDLHPGDPLLALPVGELRARLERLPKIRSATVARSLPHSLHVAVRERWPVAVWQRAGALQLIDDQGVLLGEISQRDLVRYPDLPLLVGEEAEHQIGKLFTMLSAEPELADQVESAVWVGQRRWNIRLRNGLEVRLPEENPQESWHRLASLVQEYALLDRKLELLDMRLPDRLFLKAIEESKPAKTGASST